MKTTYLIGLLTLGFFMLFLGWPWWLGIGIMVLSMALAVGGEEASQEFPNPIARRMATPIASGPIEGQPRKKYAQWEIDQAKEENEFGDVEDLIWNPGMPSDGMLGLNPMGSAVLDPQTGPSGEVIRHGVGPLSGQSTTDLGPIRIKDDMRFRPVGADKSFMADPFGEKSFLDWRWRTHKKTWIDLTRMNDPVWEQVEKDAGYKQDGIDMAPWVAEKNKRIKEILASEKQ